MFYHRSAAPASILTLAQCKDHLRVDSDDTDHDPYITALMAVVERLVLSAIGRAGPRETWIATTAAPDAQNRMCLDMGPDPAVTQVEVRRAGAYVTLVAETDYTTRQIATDVLIVRPVSPQAGGSGSWGVYDTDETAFRITFTRGYGDEAGDLPEPVIQAMLLELGDLFTNRDASVLANIVRNPAAQALISMYRAAVV